MVKVNKDIRKKIVFVFIVFIVAVCFFVLEKNTKIDKEDDVFLENQNDSNYIEKEKNSEEKENEEKEKNEKIIVHIVGEVNKRGVYSIDKGSRIKDIIEIAGGLTENADEEKINLATILEDEMKIYVPNKNEKVEEKEVDKSENINKEIKKIKININTGTKEELESVTGIGPSTAEKIILYRKENGKFKKIEDIKNVKGIGETKFEKIKKEIEV